MPNPKLPTIYFDNDECLQTHARISSLGPNSETIVSAPDPDPDYNKDHPYLIIYKRPGIDELLSNLRKTHKVKLLTFARRQSALTINKLCNFGFAEDDIIAREDILGTTALHSEYPNPISRKTDPNSILIDDHGPHSGYLQCKANYLGIPTSKCIKCHALYPTVPSPETLAEGKAYTAQLGEEVQKLLHRVTVRDDISR